MPSKDEKLFRSRLGFYYYPDTLHFGNHDADIWAPELEKLGSNWVLLQSPLERAIPESFLAPFIQANIEPVLHFDLPTNCFKVGDGLQLLFNHYARQGVRYVILFDRPNIRPHWSASIWAQDDLVERFLDQFLTVADLAQYEGLNPVLPPLEPGGDYWDLAFLRAALRSIQRRGNQRLMDALILSVFARAENKPLDWGSGGLDRWPGVRPYVNQPGIQDHRGFRMFDWYLDICVQELGKSLPLIMLEAGSNLGDNQFSQFPLLDELSVVQRNLSIIRWLHREPDVSELTGNVPDEILACFFEIPNLQKHDIIQDSNGILSNPFLNEVRRWAASHRIQLTDAPEWNIHKTSQTNKSGKSPSIMQAVHPERRYSFNKNNTYKGELSPALAEFGMSPINGELEKNNAKEALRSAEISEEGGVNNAGSISHYVLLPLYAWGAAEWDMELVLSLFQDQHPTIGFSMAEASMADFVTVVGGKEVYSDQALESLRQSGCVVKRLMPDGTLVAT